MINRDYTLLLVSAFLVLIILTQAVAVSAQATQFAYQGLLTDGGNPANGAYDLQFKLFSALSAGAQQGTTISLEDVPASNGIFKVTLDFGAPAFPGADRFLEISVRPGVSTGAYTTLVPRQQLTSSPYAIRTLSAAAADSLSAACVNCVTSGQIASVAGSQVTGALPISTIPAGSGNYVQNTTTTQAAANFNISGNGTAGGTLSGNVVNATTQFDLNGIRILTKVDTNLIAGESAGSTLTIGNFNSFFGYQAGNNTTDGHSNTFLGSEAGRNNLGQNGTADAGSYNTFIGRQAGYSNTTGQANTFVGRAAGQSNQSGNNSFFGEKAGLGNTTGSNNSFFGQLAGFNHTIGSNNLFLGQLAGFNSTTGNGNVLLGNGADFRSLRVLRSGEVTGDNNLFLGRLAGGANTRRNATAIGSYAFAACDDCMVLGDSSTPTFKVGIGTDTPGYKLDVFGILRAASSNSNDIQVETFGGTNAWARLNMKTLNQTWSLGTSQNFNGDQFYLYDSTNNLTRMSVLPGSGAISFPNGNVGIGTTDPQFKLHVRSSAATYMVYGQNDSSDPNAAGVAGSAENGVGVLGTSLSGSGVRGAAFSNSGKGVHGTSTGTGTGVFGQSVSGIGVQGESASDTGYGGYFSNTAGGIAGYFQGSVQATGSLLASGNLSVAGKIKLNHLDDPGTQPLCYGVNAAIALCSSSLRYKDNVLPLQFGLDLIQRLRPVTFNWKANQQHDLGLIAEEVAKVEPLLVTRNQAGEIEGVKYAQINVILVNAVKEQQAQIEAQKTQNALLQKQLTEQRQQIEAMTRLICHGQPEAALCQVKQ